LRHCQGVMILMGLLSLLIAAHAQDDAFTIITPANAGQLEVIQTIQLGDTYANQVAFNPTDSTQLAVIQNDGMVSVRSAISGEKIRDWKLEGKGVSVAYTTDGTRLITADDSGDVIIWDMSPASVDTVPASLINLKREGEIPQSVDTAENDLLAVVYKDGPTRLWNSDTGLLYTTIHGYKGIQYAIDLRSDGKLLAIGYRWGDGQVFIYEIDLNSPQQVSLKNIYYTGELQDVVLNLNSDSPIFFDDVGLITVNNFYPIQIGDSFWLGPPHMYIPKIEMAYAERVAVNSDGQLIAVGGKETTGGGGCTREESLLCHVEVVFFFLKETEDYGTTVSEEIVADLKGHDAWLTDVIFSPDDRFLATSSMDSTIMIWGIPQL
jgi:WD40 repeat protein